MKARKKDTPAGGRKNYFLETLLFLAVMVLTLRFCFSGQKPQEIWAAVKSMRGMSLAGAVALGLFFVCMEGTIIRILLGAAGGKSGLLTCISYSFLGFFYSGITPSATGGQPMQLYEMKKDGNSVSSSTVVLMVTAVCYKLVLGLYRYISADFSGENAAAISWRIFRSVSSGAVFESGDHVRRDWNDCPAAMDNRRGKYF